MPNRPLVSVVIPCYQSERTIGATVSSALTQTYPHIEVIVVDDGSTDQGPEILAGHGDLIRVVTQPNAGVSAARNAGAAVARGDLIALFDADDIFFPGFVEQCVSAWEAAGRGHRFVTSEAFVLSGEGVFSNRLVLPFGAVSADCIRTVMLEGNAVNGHAVVPAEMWHDLNGFDESMTHAEDYDFWLRAVFAGWEPVFVLTPQAMYRRMSTTASRAADKMLEGVVQAHQRLLESGVPLSQAERDMLEFSLSHGPTEAHVTAGERALASGDRRTARREFALAGRLSPSSRRVRVKAELLRLPGTTRPLTYLQARRQRQVDA